ncbi:fibrinogen-like protein A [Saccostrea echinata]|uniref:fibrinogen-like protein A n=1 Tax=Saccostrea echinata TaxID=191078 RepID=UPI002A83D872|nr:fibrinogen-like protein A [Saccostrea echinata]
MELAASPKVISVYLIGQTLTLLQTCYSQCFDPKTLIISNYENSSVPGFNLLNNAGIRMCMMVCNKFELCRSVDWIREKKICRINTRFATKNVSGLMTEGRTIHVDRENFPKHLAADCPKHACTEDAICLRGNCMPVLKDCSDIVKRNPSKKGQNGVYVIYPDILREVFCDMTTDGGGWTVIQKRQDGDVDFYRTWIEYKNEFGNATKNYWIGNEAIYALTKDKNQELRVDLHRHNGEQAYALYTTFYIGDENNKYTLTVSGYNGTAGDSLDYHNGMKFSTKDQDNDNGSGFSCATDRHGAWWYNSCDHSNLNGQYATSAVSGDKYPVWDHWKGWEALKQTVMMIRHKN